MYEAIDYAECEANNKKLYVYRKKRRMVKSCSCAKILTNHGALYFTFFPLYFTLYALQTHARAAMRMISIS